jgi:hypothetical protein
MRAEASWRERLRMSAASVSDPRAAQPPARRRRRVARESLPVWLSKACDAPIFRLLRGGVLEGEYPPARGA